MSRPTIFFCFALLSLTAYSASAYAEEPDAELSSPWSVGATVTAVTDYVDRGYSESDEHPALQGELYVDHDSGLSAWLWTSNVDFDDGDEATVEVDGGLSYTVTAGPGDATISGVYYAYPGADSDLNYSYGELIGGYEFNIAEAADIEAQIAYAPDFFGDSGEAYYTSAGLTIPVNAVEGLDLTGSAGYQWIEDNDEYGAPDYADWSVGLEYTWESVGFGVRYTDTDVSRESCGDLCDSRLIGLISYSLP